MKLLRDERGAAMVEFALVVPLLLLLIFGIAEFGRAWNINQTLADAAREGARRAVVRDGPAAAKVGDATTPGTVPAVVLDRLRRAGISTRGAWDPADYTADCTGWAPPADEVTGAQISGCGWGRTTGEEARVAIRLPYGFLLVKPLLALLGGEIDGRTFETNYVMRNE